MGIISPFLQRTLLTSLCHTYHNMQDVLNMGVTLPRDLVKKIDKIRGDIPRSRFIRRLLEKVCVEAGVR